MKIGPIICGIITIICLFVAYERYQENVGAVNAVNSMRNSAHQSMGRHFPGSAPNGLLGPGTLEPATPSATKYALFFALIAGISGVVLHIKTSDSNEVA